MTPDELDRSARVRTVHLFWTSQHMGDKLAALLLDCGLNGPFMLRPELADASPEVKDAYRNGVLAVMNLSDGITADEILTCAEEVVDAWKRRLAEQ